MLLLTLNLGCGNCQPPPATQVKRNPEPVVVKAYICAWSLEYNVDPAFAMAVAHIESRKGKREFRLGLMGRTYYGPMGIHRCFLKRWRVDHWRENVRVGVRALRGVGSSRARQCRRLRKYNAAFNKSYWTAIIRATREYDKEWE